MSRLQPVVVILLLLVPASVAAEDRSVTLTDGEVVTQSFNLTSGDFLILHVELGDFDDLDARVIIDTGASDGQASFDLYLFNEEYAARFSGDDFSSTQILDSAEQQRGQADVALKGAETPYDYGIMVDNRNLSSSDTDAVPEGQLVGVVELTWTEVDVEGGFFTVFVVGLLLVCCIGGVIVGGFGLIFYFNHKASKRMKQAFGLEPMPGQMQMAPGQMYRGPPPGR